MSIELSKRAKNLKESATLALAAKAKALKAQGKDILSLTVGEPDWESVPSACKAGVQAINEGQTRYTPASGTPSLKKIIVQKYNEDFKTDYVEANVSVAAGAKYSLFAAFQSLLDPGDFAIIPQPYWVSYPDMIALCGASSQAVDFQNIAEEKDKQKTYQRALEKKPKMLLLNSPNNPSGLSLSKEDLAYIVKELKSLSPTTFIICDDIYNRLVFDGSARAPHILDVAPEMLENLLSINGASKSFAMTGWRIGWAVGPQPLIKAMANFQSQSTGCPSSISQVAVEAALSNADEDVEKAKSILVQRRDLFMESLQSIEHINYETPTGAFYLWVDISYYLKKTGWSGADFCQSLLEQQGLAVVPGGVFGQEDYIRLSFAVDEQTIQRSVARLQDFLKSL